MTDGWDILLHNFYVDESYDETNRMFATKIYQRDFRYIKNNYHKIVDPDKRNECFMIAAAFSNDTNIIQFIVDKFRINPNFINKYSNNCLFLACIRNSPLSI